MIESKSRYKLEYDRILEALSQKTMSSLGKSEALKLRPSSDKKEIQHWFDEVDEILTLMRHNKSLPLSRFSDLNQSFHRLGIGSTLGGEELIQIAHVLKIAREIKEFFKDLNPEEFELPALMDLNNQLNPPHNIERLINSKIEDSGEVKRSASPKLSQLSEAISQKKKQIRTELDQMTKGGLAKYLSDPLVTMRGDSYVIPVKAEYRSQIRGIVHDQSSTGQTLFIEPQVVSDLNNQLRLLYSQERHEIQRILESISMACQPYSEDIKYIIDILTRIDVIQAKAYLARDWKAIRPKISDGGEVKLYGARHPLIDAKNIVANDIVIGADIQMIIVTGPNTGGKTVILKTLGLLQLMAQTGLFIPAEQESQIAIFDQILADIGDEQSIEQNLSTFSSHMTMIVQMINQATNHSLLLFDELGAGTDPQEGASLAIAILNALQDIGATVMVTSHYPELKAYGYNTPSAMNASMAFDTDTLKPTYHFLRGIPGRSNAFEIARRLGLDEQIIAHARQGVSGQSREVDEMIADLNEKQQVADQTEKTFKKHLLEAEKWHRKLKQAYEDFNSNRSKWEKQAKARLNEQLEEKIEKAEKIIDDIRQMQLQTESDAPVKEHELIDAKTRLHNLTAEREALSRNKVLQKAKDQKALKVGAVVMVQPLQQQGTIVEQVEDDAWMVQLGMMKIKANEKDLQLMPSASKARSNGTTVRASVGSVSGEIDLRGMRVEDAVTKLDQYLDQALLAHLKQVTIIHGVGTGAVRRGVHEALKTDSRVKNFQIAPANQGGAGATIAQF